MNHRDMNMLKRKLSSRIPHALLAVVLAAVTASPARAQERPERGERGMRGSRNREQAKLCEAVRSAFRDAVAAASRSTVVVKADGKEVALGTVVAADGWIVTKASELSGDRITCTPRGGSELPAKLVGVATQHDLAMLK